MALTINEAWKSGEGSLGRSSHDVYKAIVSGDPVADNADDPGTIMTFAVPRFATVSAMGNIINSFDRERIAPGKWVITANYLSPTLDRQTSDSAFSFSTGGGTQHITHSRRTVSSYSATKDEPPDYKGAIGVTDTSVDGVDIQSPAGKYRTTFYLASISNDYVAQLHQLTYNVNSDAVAMNIDGVTLKFKSGELLFEGAEGSKRNGFGDWELTLNWAASPNATNLTVGPINGIIKNGWDYLWVKYQPIADDTSNALLQTPAFVYIEQVYAYSPLGGLIPASAFTVPWLSPSVGGAPI